jgi:16S rRNA (cytosine967-C5)-methyltransferase
MSANPPERKGAAARKPTPPRHVSPARRAAYDILLTLERGRAHSDDLLRGRAVNALSAADRNLATTLVLGVLRWQIRLDHQLRPLLKRPNARLDAEILVALRLGVFQLLHLDRIPAHAAIDESVELAKQAGHSFAARMVNAVLRKLGTANAQFADATASELALAEAHPAWMVERWACFYGLEAARAICLHGQRQPPLTVRLAVSAEPAAENSATADYIAADERELLAAGVELQPGELLTAARTVVGGDATALIAMREGHVRVQDEGSQLVAEIACGAASLNQDQKKILDCCAAPGGKTLILAERNPHAQILACESSPQRLDQLRTRMADYADRVECRLADATELAEENTFDLVLADVPCSGTGTLGRNPEIRHRLHAEDLPRQAERQIKILRSALRAARPGGRVVYSTCSLEPEENEQVIAAVVASESSAHAAPLAPVLDALLGDGILTGAGTARLRACVTHEGAIRLLPGAVHTDGFFISLLEKR